MIEALIVLATVLSRFKLHTIDDTKIGCDPSVTLRPASEIAIRLEDTLTLNKARFYSYASSTNVNYMGA